MNKLDAALNLAELGLHVFPVGADCRRPLTKHGYKDASANVFEVADLWGGREDANIAIATGLLSGVFVVDIDRKNGAHGFESLKRLTEEHGALPKSWRSDTPSKGAHLYFKQPTDRSFRNRVDLFGNGSGIDIRTTGGSACAPPSARGSGGYAWVRAPWDCELIEAPTWLLGIIDPPPVDRDPPPPLRMTNADRGVRYAESAVAGEFSAVATMGRGGRNQQLFKSCAALGSLVGAGMLTEDIAFVWMLRAANECGLVAEDGQRAAEVTIRSGLRTGAKSPREVDLERRRRR